jgi:hypothetical protein
LQEAPVLNVICFILTIGGLIITFDRNFAKMFLYYFWGLYGSYTFHEYGHLMTIRMFKSKVYYQHHFLKISLYFHCKNDHERLVIALSGPLFSACTGLIIYLLGFFFKMTLFKRIGSLYAFHFMFILFPFGDGRIIQRRIYESIKKCTGILLITVSIVLAIIQK